MQMSDVGKDDLEALSLRQGEGENTEHAALSASTGSVSTGSISAGSVGEADSEHEESSSAPFEDAHAEFSFFSPTLGLEPRPSWIQAPAGPNAPSQIAATPRRLVYKPAIPRRPLHKQPFYRRLFFYLRTWLSRIFRKTA